MFANIEMVNILSLFFIFDAKLIFSFQIFYSCLIFLQVHINIDLKALFYNLTQYCSLK